jgi:hypothetical protein
MRFGAVSRSENIESKERYGKPEGKKWCGLRGRRSLSTATVFAEARMVGLK